MKFNSRLLVSFGIILLLLVPPVYSQTCYDVNKYVKLKYYDNDYPDKTYYGLNAKNEVQDVYSYDKVVNSVLINDISSPGYFEIGWAQTPADKYFFVAWKNTAGVYGVQPLGPATNGYYQLWAYNNGEGKFVGCVCELDSNENHVRCVGSHSEAISYLGFDQGYVNARGAIINSCDVSSRDRFARFWDLKYGPNTGNENMVRWDGYETFLNYALPLEHEQTVYKTY